MDKFEAHKYREGKAGAKALLPHFKALYPHLSDKTIEDHIKISIEGLCEGLSRSAFVQVAGATPGEGVVLYSIDFV